MTTGNPTPPSVGDSTQAAPNVNTPARVPGVAKPTMVMRSLRVPEKLWDAAKDVADEREENISDVIREALERYVEEHTEQSSS